MITLSREERVKFAAFLEQEASSSATLLDQMMKLPGHGPNHPMVKRLKLDAMSFLYVAVKLEPREEEVIGAQDVGDLPGGR
jgi:hypothetical protein